MPLIQIHLLRGRTQEQKRRLLAAVTRAVSQAIDAPPSSIRVWIHEMAGDEYMVAGKLASERETTAKK